MGTEVVNYSKAWADSAQEYAAKEKSDATFLSIRGGILKLGEDVLPGNQMCVVVLHSVFENTYYSGAYNPDEVTPPNCFALADDESDMAPHPAMQADLEHFEPQHDQCQGCPMNAYGTAVQGKGKACKNRRRIAVIPAGVYSKVKGSRDFDLEIFEDPRHYADADMVMLKIPPTSVKNYKKLISAAQSNFQRPPFGVIARVYVEPDPKSQYLVHFEVLDALPDDLFPTIHARHLQAREALMTPYSPPQEEASFMKGDGSAPAAGGLKGLRKK